MGASRRSQQPDGVKVSKTAQKMLEVLGQQAAPVAVGQLGKQRYDLHRSLPKCLARRFIRVFCAIVEQGGELRAFAAPALTDTGVEVGCVRVFHPVARGALLCPVTTLLHVESRVRQKAIRGIEAKLPARVGRVLAVEHGQHLQHGIAVGAVDLLRQLDAVVTAVAFDLAVVGVKCNLRLRAVVEQWGLGVGERGQRMVAQRGRIAVQPHPQMMLGV
ncbi:MAG: hypothetical protein QOH57_2875 [Mycobacterium sp.]|nr:hypothetical protein [Mycobacterium sp.]